MKFSAEMLILCYLGGLVKFPLLPAAPERLNRSIVQNSFEVYVMEEGRFYSTFYVNFVNKKIASILCGFRLLITTSLST